MAPPSILDDRARALDDRTVPRSQCDEIPTLRARPTRSRQSRFGRPRSAGGRAIPRRRLTSAKRMPPTLGATSFAALLTPTSDSAAPPVRGARSRRSPNARSHRSGSMEYDREELSWRSVSSHSSLVSMILLRTSGFARRLRFHPRRLSSTSGTDQRSTDAHPPQSVGEQARWRRDAAEDHRPLPPASRRGRGIAPRRPPGKTSDDAQAAPSSRRAAESSRTQRGMW
jgi:hypothetical protein